MIGLLRVDDRLIHGQVAVAWAKNLSVTDIVVANDEAAKDEFTKMTLSLAKPRGVNLKIDNVDNAIEFLLKHEKTKNNIMVIVNNILDAQKITSKIQTIKSINLGGLKKKPNSKRITGAVNLTPEDIKICKELLDDGVEIEIRQVPEEKKLLLKNMI